MNNTNWKSLGWLITRKIFYYIIIIVAFVALLKASFWLMNIASTIVFIGGLFGVGLAVGLGVTALIRELAFYFSITHTETNKTNKTDTNTNE